VAQERKKDIDPEILHTERTNT